MIREKNIDVNGSLIREKALEFAAKAGVENFQASTGWLTRFKRRENIDWKGCSICNNYELKAISFFFQAIYPLI